MIRLATLSLSNHRSVQDWTVGRGFAGSKGKYRGGTGGTLRGRKGAVCEELTGYDVEDLKEETKVLA